MSVEKWVGYGMQVAAIGWMMTIHWQVGAVILLLLVGDVMIKDKKS